jgi:hypothetical protein
MRVECRSSSFLGEFDPSRSESLLVRPPHKVSAAIEAHETRVCKKGQTVLDPLAEAVLYCQGHKSHEISLFDLIITVPRIPWNCAFLGSKPRNALERGELHQRSRGGPPAPDV